jgi:hypothetical protein
MDAFGPSADGHGLCARSKTATTPDAPPGNDAGGEERERVAAATGAVVPLFRRGEPPPHARGGPGGDDPLGLAESADAGETPARDPDAIRERLARLRALPGILNAAAEDTTAGAALPFSLLPLGLPRGALTELSGPDGGGKTEAAIRALAENPEVRAAWVEESLTVYPCAFPALGVPMERVLFAEPGRELLWTVHQLLRSRLFGIVVAAPGEALTELELRRLQLSAERSRSSLILLREHPTLRRNWPIRVQAEIRRVGPDERSGERLEARLLSARIRSLEAATAQGAAT